MYHIIARYHSGNRDLKDTFLFQNIDLEKELLLTKVSDKIFCDTQQPKTVYWSPSGISPIFHQFFIFNNESFDRFTEFLHENQISFGEVLVTQKLSSVAFDPNTLDLIKPRIIKDIRDWVVDHNMYCSMLGGVNLPNNYRQPFKIAFSNLDHAMLFKLSWSDVCEG